MKDKKPIKLGLVNRPKANNNVIAKLSDTLELWREALL